MVVTLLRVVVVEREEVEVVRVVAVADCREGVAVVRVVVACREGVVAVRVVAAALRVVEVLVRILALPKSLDERAAERVAEAPAVRETALLLTVRALAFTRRSASKARALLTPRVALRVAKERSG